MNPGEGGCLIQASHRCLGLLSPIIQAVLVWDSLSTVKSPYIPALLPKVSSGWACAEPTSIPGDSSTRQTAGGSADLRADTALEIVRTGLCTLPQVVPGSSFAETVFSGSCVHMSPCAWALASVCGHRDIVALHRDMPDAGNYHSEMQELCKHRSG